MPLLPVCHLGPSEYQFLAVLFYLMLKTVLASQESTICMSFFFHYVKNLCLYVKKHYCTPSLYQTALSVCHLCVKNHRKDSSLHVRLPCLYQTPHVCVSLLLFQPSFFSLCHVKMCLSVSFSSVHDSPIHVLPRSHRILGGSSEPEFTYRVRVRVRHKIDSQNIWRLSFSKNILNLSPLMDFPPENQKKFWFAGIPNIRCEVHFEDDFWAAFTSFWEVRGSEEHFSNSMWNSRRM